MPLKKKKKRVFSIFSSLCIKSESKRYSWFLLNMKKKKALCFLLPVIASARMPLGFWVSWSKGCDFLHFWIWRHKCSFKSLTVLSVSHSAVRTLGNRNSISHRRSEIIQGWAGQRRMEGHSWPLLCHPHVHDKGCSIKRLQVQKKLIPGTREFRTSNRIPFPPKLISSNSLTWFTTWQSISFHWLSCYYGI